MRLVERIERTNETRYILDGRGPAAAQYWDDYRVLESMLSEKHSAALFMAQAAKERGDAGRQFTTDLPQPMLDSLITHAPGILRKLDRDIKSIIDQGGNDAIMYLKTLSTVRGALTDTISHMTRLVGI